MKVELATNICQGRGQCVIVCPQIFKADDQGFGYVDSGDVPTDDENAVRKAENLCPERAIRITND